MKTIVKFIFKKIEKFLKNMLNLVDFYFLNCYYGVIEAHKW